MTKIDSFISWAESKGAEVEIIQPDDGGGYTVIGMKLPDHIGEFFEVTVNELWITFRSFTRASVVASGGARGSGGNDTGSA